MNNKENDPDNLGGLGDLLPAEVLKKLNELLELLHQTGNKQQGSNNTLIYVAPGAQYVKNLYQQQTPLPNLTPTPSPKEREHGGREGYESAHPPQHLAADAGGVW